jgi:hypothetical protein
MLTRALLKYGTAKIPLIPGDFSGGTLNQGIQERITNKINDLGEQLFGEAESSQRQGAFVLQYGKMNKEVMALLFGHPLETEATTEAFYHSTFKAVAAKAAVTAGQHGHGMVADVAAGSASYIDQNGRTVALTRQPAFATFTPATPLSYTQGANAAFKFSDDLVAAGYDVTPFVPYPVIDADRLDHDPFGLFEVWLQGVIQYKGVKEVYQIHFSEAQLNRQENSAIDPAQTPVSVNFRDLSPTCVIDLKFLNRTVVC